MSEANPIVLVEELRTVLGRYIATTLPISRRYPRLAQRFRLELQQQKLVDGPYVEALPDFEKGVSLNALLKKNGGFLHDALAVLPTADRPLHRHQQLALEYAARDGKSLLVATGTGSGKTETFLYPIAHTVLADPEPEKPGVRALLIYPMNALANDQLYYRIAPLFGNYLARHGITFGRYTGQVKANTSQAEEASRLFENTKLMEALDYPQRIPGNWMLTREDMLRDPPKVLITNYAMLEHLLLLPRNERLFSANALRCIVLDEIHTYHGAQATEVSFLLRKLKNRLGVNTPLQVFGTSASLADGADADEKLKAFARDLFGEEVHEVVRGKRIVHERLQRSVDQEFSLSVQEWIRLGRVLEALTQLPESDRSTEMWHGYLEEHDLLSESLEAPEEEELGQFLEKRFAENHEARRVAGLLDKPGVIHFSELAQRLFDSPLATETAAERGQALSAVIRMGMVAQADKNGFPLLPGRYHLAVNSIEGVAVLPATGDEGWSQIRVARHHQSEEGRYYPLLVCRKCGQPYFEGYEEGGQLHSRRPDHSDAKVERRVFWLGTPVGHVDDEDDEADDSAPEYKRSWLEPKTGLLGATADAVQIFALVTEEDEEERAWYVRKCPACGSRAAGTDAEIVTRMHPGNEALGSVVAQRVLESLPAGMPDHADPHPASGRNLLSFSDNRQDAAFFAPYFERTAADLALRSAIRHVVRGRETPINARQMAEQIFSHWQQDGRQAILLDANGDIRTDRHDVTEILLGAIGAEFCTPGGRRNSLESLGVVHVTYDEARLRPLRQKIRACWPEALPKDDRSIEAMIHFLLENIRRERALAKFYGIPLRDAFIWREYDQHRSFEIDRGNDDVKFRWLPLQQQNRHNRRTWYLIQQLGLPRDQAFEFLRAVWDALSRPPVSLMLRHQPGFALDGEAIRFHDGDRYSAFICRSCGLRQSQVLNSKCTAFGCRGDVEAITPEERSSLLVDNHYLASYEEPGHVTVRAREHTASLSTDLREQIERQFAERKVNLLSCTTTMEMGVDLGDLEAVINLNVPPGIANYQQRTGRAGRRAQAAPFCVTVARNTHYDQAVFRDFSRYLASQPATPFIHLDNPELFWRHQQSVLLSHFLRQRIANADLNAPALENLFVADFDEDALRAFTEQLYKWLESEYGQAAIREAESLAEHLPAVYRHIGLSGSYLRNRFLAAMQEFAAEVSCRYCRYTEKMSEAKAADELSKAARWQRMRKEFMGQFLVNQLSRRGLIPTYSFPVHSLSLEVIRDGQQQYQKNPEVALSRDASQGISEYAPGAEIIANGRIWESAGLAHYPRAFMPDRWYVACEECFHVDIGDARDDLPPACSNCGSTQARRRRMFVEPHGFVTSYAERKGRDPGSSRRRVKAADEARLIAAPREDAFVETDLPFLRTSLLKAKGEEGSLHGTLFISNRGTYGEGYYRCLRCNHSEPVKPLPPQRLRRGTPAAAEGRRLVHDDPLSGTRCPNDRMSRIGVDFAHRFDTDVRLFRFLAPLPKPRSESDDPRRHHDQLARTISEALRLAVIELMQLQPGEIRATYRLYGAVGSTLEIVLYDGVPGGAGYCARLGEAGFSVRELLGRTRQRLDCLAGCDSACRVCLCDYGNQRYWDSFDRQPALAWLDSLLVPDAQPAGPGHYVRWPAPSLAGLTERLATFPSLHLIGRSLVEATGYAEESLNLLVDWLQAGKTIHIYLVNELESHPTAHAILSVYRRLHPYALEGRLRAYRIPASKSGDWSVLPRVFTETTIGLPVVRQHFPVQPLLECLISAPADTGIVDEDLSRELASLVGQATPYAADAMAEGDRMAIWELQAGEDRDLPTIFRSVAGAYVKELVIRDPYCGAANHRFKLKVFLEALTKILGTVDHLTIQCRETRDKDGHVEFYLDVERHVDDLVKSIGFENRDVQVRPIKGSARTFHDREIDVLTVSRDGCEVLHRYFLTGGIDYLMETRAATKVFSIVINR